MLNINNLNIELNSAYEQFYILKNFSLDINKGEILGLAGESGSGKSVLAKTILGIISDPVIKTGGTITLDGNKLETKNDFKRIRGSKITMIFQNPLSSLNPVMTVGSQLVETIKLHNKKISNSDAHIEAEKLLTDVEIDNPKDRLNAYPHQLSGGMNQRVMIALALAANPEILIADEPTTALDVTTQTQIINLIKKLNKSRGLTILFISHDLSLLSAICDRVAILYCAELMEIADKSKLNNNSLSHPYTIALKKCIPQINEDKPLNTIRGTIGRNTTDKNNSCIFVNRCDYADNTCKSTKPIFNGQYACHHPVIAAGE